MIMMIVDSKAKVRRSLKIKEIDNNRIENDGRLIAEAQTDPAALARLYRRHYDAVFRYCVHRLFDRHLAEDLTSEVFLKAVENFYKFKGSEKQFRNWLYAIATNTVNNYLRKAGRREKALKAVYQSSRDNARNCEKTSPSLIALKKAMLGLKPKYQTIITLRFFENLKLNEIADIVDSGYGTVRSRMSRALKLLAKRTVTEKEAMDYE